MHTCWILGRIRALVFAADWTRGSDIKKGVEVWKVERWGSNNAQRMEAVTSKTLSWKGYRAVRDLRSLYFYNWSFDQLGSKSPYYNDSVPLFICLEMEKTRAACQIFPTYQHHMDLYRGYMMWQSACFHMCGCVSITHQLKWPPWCSRRLTVLMATTTRNIFFCDISLCFTGTAWGRDRRARWVENVRAGIARERGGGGTRKMGMRWKEDDD